MKPNLEKLIPPIFQSYCGRRNNNVFHVNQTVNLKELTECHENDSEKIFRERTITKPLRSYLATITFRTFTQYVNKAQIHIKLSDAIIYVIQILLIKSKELLLKSIWSEYQIILLYIA